MLSVKKKIHLISVDSAFQGQCEVTEATDSLVIPLPL